MGRFGQPKRPNRRRFGLITWAVFDIRVGRHGFGPFWSFPCISTNVHQGSEYIFQPAHNDYPDVINGDILNSLCQRENTAFNFVTSDNK